MAKFIARIIGLSALLLMLMVVPGRAGGAVAQPEVTEAGLRNLLQGYLDKEGYLGNYRNGQGFQRGVSAYLWDHRHWLKTTDFHNSLQIDALTCLLHKKGYPGLEVYVEKQVIKNWCDVQVIQP